MNFTGGAGLGQTIYFYHMTWRLDKHRIQTDHRRTFPVSLVAYGHFHVREGEMMQLLQQYYSLWHCLENLHCSVPLLNNDLCINIIP